MAKIALEILLCISIVIIYILALIAATMLSVRLFGMEDADNFDYAMIANSIQFFVMVVIIAEKVAQWMT